MSTASAQPIAKGFGKADRADRVGEVDLGGDVAGHRMQRVVRLCRDAGHDEDQVVALRCEPVMQGGDGGIVVDIGGLDRQCIGGQSLEARRVRALGRGDPPAALQEGLDEAEPEAARGPDDQRVLLGSPW